MTIPLSRYTADPNLWTERRVPWGIRVPNDTEAESLGVALSRASIVMVEFPKFTDGRGYSLARCLRRAGYEGELRATGDVLRDQIAFMERCGFDAFALKPGKNIETALLGFDELSPAYQAAADEQPASWRRTPSPSPLRLV